MDRPEPTERQELTTGDLPSTSELDYPERAGMMRATPYVYIVGRIEPRFPSLGVEKEIAQVAARTERGSGLEAMRRDVGGDELRTVLSDNRYLLRQMCWVLSVEGLETYILQPRDLADFDQLTNTLRSSQGNEEPSPTYVDVVIGVRGPGAPPEMCNGLVAPIVAFDQIYSFDADTFIRSMPRPEDVSEEQFRPIVESCLQMTVNTGATDEYRALNYLMLRYPPVYATTAEAMGRNSSLTRVETRPSRLSDTRRIIEVIFSYTNRETNFVEQFCVRVDVTEEYPFLVSGIAPYYAR